MKWLIIIIATITLFSSFQDKKTKGKYYKFHTNGDTLYYDTSIKIHSFPDADHFTIYYLKDKDTLQMLVGEYVK